MEFSINFKFSNLFIAFIFSLLVVATCLFSPNFFNNNLEVHQIFGLGAIQSLNFNKFPYLDANYQYGPGILMLNYQIMNFFDISIYSLRLSYLILSFIFIFIFLLTVSIFFGNKVLSIFFLSLEIFLNYSHFVFEIFTFYQGRWISQIILIILFIFYFKFKRNLQKNIFLFFHSLLIGLFSFLFNEVLSSYILGILILMGLMYMNLQMTIVRILNLILIKILISVISLFLFFSIFTYSFEPIIFFNNYFRGSNLLIYGISNMPWRVWGNDWYNLYYSSIFYMFTPFMAIIFFSLKKFRGSAINFYSYNYIALFSISISLFLIALFRSEVNHLKGPLISFLLFLVFTICNYKKIFEKKKNSLKILICLIPIFIIFNPEKENSNLLNYYKYSSNLNYLFKNINHIVSKDNIYEDIYYKKLGKLIITDEESSKIHEKWSKTFNKLRKDINDQSVALSTDSFPITVNDHKWHITQSFFYFFLDINPFNKYLEEAYNIWTNDEKIDHDNIAKLADCLIFTDLKDNLYQKSFKEKKILKNYIVKINNKEINILLSCKKN